MSPETLLALAFYSLALFITGILIGMGLLSWILQDAFEELWHFQGRCTLHCSFCEDDDKRNLEDIGVTGSQSGPMGEL
jgi:hypothetical protein